MNGRLRRLETLEYAELVQHMAARHGLSVQEVEAELAKVFADRAVFYAQHGREPTRAEVVAALATEFDLPVDEAEALFVAELEALP